MAPAAGDILFVDTNVLLTATNESRHLSANRTGHDEEAALAVTTPAWTPEQGR